jgi:hypothetical protein
MLINSIFTFFTTTIFVEKMESKEYYDEDYGNKQQKLHLHSIRNLLKPFILKMFVKDGVYIPTVTLKSELESGSELLEPFRISFFSQPKLPFSLRDRLFTLVETNMKQFYVNSTLGWNSVKKRLELLSYSDSYYFIITLIDTRDKKPLTRGAILSSFSDSVVEKDIFVGFCQIRLIVENEQEVIYLFETCLFYLLE